MKNGGELLAEPASRNDVSMEVLSSRDVFLLFNLGGAEAKMG